jgi:hypothetical protein
MSIRYRGRVVLGNVVRNHLRTSFGSAMHVSATTAEMALNTAANFPMVV